MQRLKMSILSGMSLILLAIMLLTAEGTSASSGTWHVVKSPNPGLSINQLMAVATISANDVWAVGTADNTGIGGQYQTLTEHWNGTTWKNVKSRNSGTHENLLEGVAAVSTSNVWAVGYYGNDSAHQQTLTEHWNGTKWSIVRSPNVGTSGNVLFGVAAISTSNILAVGASDYGLGSEKTLIEQWDGTKWNVIPSPNNGTGINQLNAISVISASDIWAVGFYYNPSLSQTLIEHWNGTAWSIIPSPSPSLKGENALNAVAAVSTSNVWAVGVYNSNADGGVVTLIEEWNGGSWSVVPSPNAGSYPISNYLQGVAVVSANEVWAVGYEGNLSDVPTVKTLIEQWNGSSWSIVTSPSPGAGENRLYGAAVLASTVWAVGAFGTTGAVNNRTLTESYP